MVTASSPGGRCHGVSDPHCQLRRLTRGHNGQQLADISPELPQRHSTFYLRHDRLFASQKQSCLVLITELSTYCVQCSSSINLEFRCVKILLILCKEPINVVKCDFGDNTFYFMLVTELLHKISFDRVE